MSPHRFPHAEWELQSSQPRPPIRHEPYDPTRQAKERNPSKTTISNHHRKLNDKLENTHMPVASGDIAFVNTSANASAADKCYPIERTESPLSVSPTHPGLAGYSSDKNPTEFGLQYNDNVNRVSDETVKVLDHAQVGYDASASDQDIGKNHEQQGYLALGQVLDAITASGGSAVKANIFVSMKDEPFSDLVRTVHGENEVSTQIKNIVGPATSFESTSHVTMIQCASQQVEVIQDGGQWAADPPNVVVGEDILPGSTELDVTSKAQEITHDAPIKATTPASGCAAPGNDDVGNKEEIRATNSGQDKSRHRDSLPDITGANQCHNHFQQTGACKDHVHATEPTVTNATAVDGSKAHTPEFPHRILALGPSNKFTDKIERRRRNPKTVPSGKVIPSTLQRPTLKRANHGCHETRGITSSSTGNIDDIEDNDHSYPNKTLSAKRTKLAGPSGGEVYFEFLRKSDMCNEHNPDIEDQSDEYEVGRILDVRLKGGILQYRIYWPGYGEDHTWYNASNCRNCPYKLDEFHKANPEKPGPPRRLKVWKKCCDEDKIAKPHEDDDKPEKYSARRGSRKSKQPRQAS